MIKLSIIVPVYNVEKYLPKCIESILQQSFRDFELILVNDGSTDKSGDICKNFKEKDSRIVILQKENGGLSSARNAGLDYANGEYIAFVDSDDWIAASMYSSMVLIMEQESVDIVVCGHNVVNFDGSITPVIPVQKGRIYTGLEATKLILCDELIFSFAWDKVYKRELFTGIRYPEGRIYEDAATTYKVFHKSTSVFQIGSTYYYYLRRKDSLCYIPEKRVKRTFDNFWAFYERYIFVLNSNLYDSVKPECGRKTVVMGISLLHYIARFPKLFLEEQFWEITNCLLPLPSAENELISRRLNFEIYFLKIFPKLYRLGLRSFYLISTLISNKSRSTRVEI